MSRKSGEKNLPLVPDPELWDIVRAAITPLSRRWHAAKPVALPVVEAPKPLPLPKRPKSPSPRLQAPPPPSPPKPANPLPLTGLDRRTTQKLSRGQAEIDARLDLHGYSVELARGELRRFLSDARHAGFRTVLVITGKGESPFARHTLHSKDAWHAPERMGRLRRAVTDWFAEPEFRMHISGFQPAHPRHGGGGAYYVRLRRHDRGPE
ncbi:MAG: Smr/MutS family protein [Aestuariivirgaceae bacterium]|nr:Smr/MutS family protein [Aestuariivirgaceae bacterium]